MVQVLIRDGATTWLRPAGPGAPNEGGCGEPHPLAIASAAHVLGPTLRDETKAKDLCALLFSLIGASARGTIHQSHARQLLGSHLAEQFFHSLRADEIGYDSFEDHLLLQTQRTSVHDFQASWIEPINCQQAKCTELRSSMAFHAEQHPGFEPSVRSMEEMSNLELLRVAQRSSIQVANRTTLQLSDGAAPSTELTLKQEPSLTSVQVGAEQYYVHSPLISVLPHKSHMISGTALLTLPHSAVKDYGLVFLRRADEHSEWIALDGKGTFSETGGSLRLTQFSNFLIGRLFGRNGPEHVICRTYVPDCAILTSGNTYMAKVLAYLEHDEHKLDRFISDDDKDLDGQKRVQAWKNMQFTMFADIPEDSLHLCSNPEVKLIWDGGICKFEFEVEVPSSMTPGRHVAHFQPIPEEPDQSQISRAEHRLPLTFKVEHPETHVSSTNQHSASNVDANAVAAMSASLQLQQTTDVLQASNTTAQGAQAEAMTYRVVPVVASEQAELPKHMMDSPQILGSRAEHAQSPSAPSQLMCGTQAPEHPPAGDPVLMVIKWYICRRQSDSQLKVYEEANGVRGQLDRRDIVSEKRLDIQTTDQATWEVFNEHSMGDGDQTWRASESRVLHFGGHADDKHGLYWCSSGGPKECTPTVCTPNHLAECICSARQDGLPIECVFINACMSLATG